MIALAGPLNDNVEVLGRSNLLHLIDVERAERVEIVMAIEEDQHGPFLELGRGGQDLIAETDKTDASQQDCCDKSAHLLLREWRMTNTKCGEADFESDEDKVNPVSVYYVGTALRRTGSKVDLARRQNHFQILLN